MKLYLKYLPFVFVSVIFSCKVSEQPAGQSTDTADVEEVKADSVELQDEETHELRIYRGEKTRHFHLIHTKLDVRFDWENQQLNGRANLALRPYFYDQSELVLDAKDFDLHQISLLEGEKQIALKYDYDGKK
jgi:aminopeptidase N